LWKRTVSRIMVTLLFLSFLFPILGTSSVKSGATRTIKIADYMTGLNSTPLGNATRQLPLGGIPFVLNVSLSGQTSDLASWQVGITFDNNSLKCTDISIPESDPSYVFHGLSEAKAILFSDAAQNGTYTGGKPEILAGGALLPPINAVSVNNALLCIMNFTAFKVGEKSEAMISFWPYKPATDTFLLDSNGVDIPFANASFSVNILEGAIVPDNYPTIQAAINGVNSGDSILVRKGTYHENVVANKTVALLGEDRNMTIIDGGGLGYVVGIRGVNNVSVCNFTIQNGLTGVYAGDWGLGIESARGNIIRNLIKNNLESGIYLSQSGYSVSDNQVMSNGVGISVYGGGAVNGTLRNNDLRNNSIYNLDLNSTLYDKFDMDTTNAVDGKPVYCWVRHLDETVPSNAGQVTLFNCSNVVVQNLELMKNSVNLQLINVVNCTVENADSSFADVGVLLVNSKECSIRSNTLANCRINLQVLASVNNSFTGNYLQTNGFCGVDFDDSANNSFYHNTVNSTGATYTVYRAGNNTWDNGFEGNYWSDYNGTDSNQDGIGDTPYIIDANNSDHYPLVHRQNPTPVHNINTGLDYATIQAAIDAPETLDGHTVHVEAGTYYEHLTVNKSVSLVGDSSRTVIIDGSLTGTVVEITASNVNLTGFTIRNSGSGYQNCGVLVLSSGGTINQNNIENNGGNGMYLLSSSNSNIISNNSVMNNTETGIKIASNSNRLDGNNVVNNHYYGVSLYLSSNNSLSRNNILNNNHYGISLQSSCGNNLSDNVVGDNDDGIFLWDSSNNNTLIGNRIAGNFYHGVWLDRSSNNVLAGNNVSKNSYGVWVQDNSSFNSLVGNRLAGNQNCGLVFEDSSDNKIYHNRFENSANVVGTLGLTNTWDDGYPSGGNYWNDSNGNDVFRGVYQNETGSDGVIDSSYVIDVGNIDRYPLAEPYAGLHDIGILTLNTSEHATGHIHLWITAKVINYGEQAETFNISVKANSTTIQTQTLTLNSRNSTTFTFMWNTTRVAVGNYSITAMADIVEGETDTADNSLTLGDLVFVTVLGDITGAGGDADGVVMMQDIMAIVAEFNTRLGGSSWNPAVDVNDDGVINMRDICLAILSYSPS